ncbi:MAG TPA: hypothetical protein VN577_20190 [Terriglobales bacterium]|nr:hypothetical protein [Clostridia bacterium]HWR17161.1 hypothetical protein [Terriglobales bacterium]
MTTTPNLFGTPSYGQRTWELLLGPNPQPRALTDCERAVLKKLMGHPGERNAAPIADFAEKLNYTPRQIKEAVRCLIMEFDLPIAGSRQKPFGYYMATTSEEIQAASRPLESEVFALMQRIRALRGPSHIADFAKRLVEKVNGGSEDAA